MREGNIARSAHFAPGRLHRSIGQTIVVDRALHGEGRIAEIKLQGGPEIHDGSLVGLVDAVVHPATPQRRPLVRTAGILAEERDSNIPSLNIALVDHHSRLGVLPTIGKTLPRLGIVGGFDHIAVSHLRILKFRFDAPDRYLFSQIHHQPLRVALVAGFPEGAVVLIHAIFRPEIRTQEGRRGNRFAEREIGIALGGWGEVTNARMAGLHFFNRAVRIEIEFGNAGLAVGAIRVVGIVMTMIDDIHPIAFHQQRMVARAIHRAVIGGFQNRVLGRVVGERSRRRFAGGIFDVVSGVLTHGVGIHQIVGPLALEHVGGFHAPVDQALGWVLKTLVFEILDRLAIERAHVGLELGDGGTPPSAVPEVGRLVIVDKGLAIEHDRSLGGLVRNHLLACRPHEIGPGADGTVGGRGPDLAGNTAEHIIFFPCLHHRWRPFEFGGRPIHRLPGPIDIVLGTPDPGGAATNIPTIRGDVYIIGVAELAAARVGEVAGNDGIPGPQRVPCGGGMNLSRSHHQQP